MSVGVQSSGEGLLVFRIPHLEKICCARSRGAEVVHLQFTSPEEAYACAVFANFTENRNCQGMMSSHANTPKVITFSLAFGETGSYKEMLALLYDAVPFDPSAPPCRVTLACAQVFRDFVVEPV